MLLLLGRNSGISIARLPSIISKLRVISTFNHIYLESCFVKGKNNIYAIEYKKVRYRGLKRNENRVYAMFACANLYSLAIVGQTLVAV